jgi:magnesium-transporting ATPase (P-type)
MRAYGWLGMIEAALSLGGFFAAYWLAGWRRGEPMAGSGLVYVTATTMTLAGIVACQVGAAFACRSDHQASWRLGFASNRLLLIGIVAEIALLLLLIYAPPLQSVFGLAPLGIGHWLLLAAFGPLLLVCEEGRKAAWRRFSRAARRNPQRLSSQ